MNEIFTVNPRIIAHFGEHLIKNESIALLELVKNSYDACATFCELDFKFENNTLKSLSITDNGFGMNINVIKNVWLVIGTDFKQKKLEPNCCGRFPLGEKGIGRLGVHKLGNNITLISKTEHDKEVELKIDWSRLDVSKKIDDFIVDVFENQQPFFFNNKTGTRIVIENLKTSWDRRQLREVYRNLMSLNSPFDNSDNNDTFCIKVTKNSDVFEGLPDVKDIMEVGMYFGHCFAEGDSIIDFQYEFRPWPTLDKFDKKRTVTQNDLNQEDLKLQKFEPKIKDKNKKTYINLNESNIGPIEFDIVIFETDSQILSYSNMEKKSLKDYLRENGGIRVYRDNVRVYNYGEKDDDWLGIDIRRVSRLGGNVSNNILIGSVKLKRSDSLGLKEKTNREGFIENESYKNFVEVVDYILSLFVKERNTDKQNLSTVYKTANVTEPVLADLNLAIDLVKKIESDKTEEVLIYLNRVNDQYKTVRDVLLKSANAGLNMGAVVHEVDKLVNALIHMIEKNDYAESIQIAKRLESIITGYTKILKKTNIGNYSLSSIVDVALSNYKFRFKDHKISVISNFKEKNLTAILSEPEAISALLNILDNAIFWISHAKTDNRRISIYITDEIKDYNSIIVCDNGPGFNIPFDIAVKPFITGKPFNIGMGLGLHVVKETMFAMKGELMFLDKHEIVIPPINNKDNVVIALCFKKGNKN